MLALIRQYLVRAVSLMLAAFLILSMVPPVVFAAGSLTLSGTVTNQSGGGVLNVSVYATAPSGSVALYGPVTTDATGAYSLGIDPGTYDIHFDPPAGSGLSPIIQSNISITASQAINVQLAPATHTLSGFIRDSLGDAIPSVGLNISTISTNTPAPTATTDATGHYSIAVNAGTYYVTSISGTQANTLLGRVAVQFNGGAGAVVDLTNADLAQDFTLPVATLNVTVKDRNGNLVANSPVTVSPGSVALFALTPGGQQDYYSGNSQTGTTNSSGTTAITTYQSTYPAGTICATISGARSCNTAQLTLAAGTSSLTIQQPAASTFSGFLRDSTGNPVTSATINLSTVATNTPAPAITTDATGHFTSTLNADQYYVTSISSSTASIPLGRVSVQFNGGAGQVIDLRGGNLNQDLTLPVASLVLTVKNNAGNPVNSSAITISPGSLNLFALTPGGQQDYYSGNNQAGTTNVSGNATVVTYQGTYPAGTICAVVSAQRTCNTASVTLVSGANSLTIQQPPTHTISGTLRDSTGNALANVVIALDTTSTNTAAPTVTTDSSGHYSLTLNADQYYVNSMSGLTTAPLGRVSVQFNGGAGAVIDLRTTDQTQDFTLGVSTLNVTVKDGFGNPLTNTTVTVAPGSLNLFALTPGGQQDYYSGNNQAGTTNSSGVTTITTYQGVYPAGTVCVTLSGNRTCNATQLSLGSTPTSLLFQAAPQAPPTPTGLTATTPTTSAPALSWNPVAVASSYNIYRNSVKVGSSATTTFTDSALVLSGSYQYTVTAVSALNVESSVSTPFTVVFNGQGPVVTNVQASPNPVDIGQSATLSATVSDSFATITNAEYFEGTDPGEGNGTPMAIVSGIATATLPSTLSLGQHTFTVRAKNSFGNWTRGTLPTVTVTVTSPKLTGRVLNGANIGLSNVRVDVVNPADHTQVLFTTNTDSNGNYSLTVTPGTYDVIYTPTDPTYQPVIKTGIDLSVDRTLDVVLVLTPHSFTGTLTDENNVPIKGATLSFQNQGGQTVIATTAADGSFSASLNPASYSVTISGTKAAAPQAFIPTSFTLNGGAFDLSSDVAQNFVVPAVNLTLTAKSALTNATIGGVSLNISTTTATTLYPGSATYSGSTGYNVTDGSGVASVVVLSGSTYTVNATPPDDTGVVATAFPAAGPITADTSADLLLTANIKHFIGHFTDSTSTGISGATVSLSGPLGSFQGVTDQNGDVDVPVAAGTYNLAITGAKPSGSSLHIPDLYSFTNGTVDLSTADVTQNLTLAAANVTVTAESSFGEQLSNVQILLDSTPGTVALYPGSTFDASDDSMGVTGDNGQVTLYVATGLSYTTKATPAAGSGYIVTNLAAGDVVSADTSWNIALNRDLKQVIGTVVDKNGTSVVGATVRLDGNEADQHYVATTDQSGSFVIYAAPNSSYNFQISGTQAASPLAYLPDNFTLNTTISVTADTTENITINAVNLDILARDDRLTPIPNVGIAFTSNGSQNGFSASSSTINRTTGSDGHTQLLMLAGTTYTISATPPVNMGYVNTTFNGTSPITQDAAVVIQFQNHIPLAPTGVVAPAVTATFPTISWNPVAGADYYRIYRDGVPIGTSITTSFTDTSLTSDGTYHYQVSAVSADGFEGPQSAAVTVLYDTTPPTISYSLSPAPNANTWNNSSVTVTFTCSDALSGLASCSQPVTLLTEGFAQTVTGTARDNAGNVSSVTASVNIDTTAPTITHRLSQLPNSNGWNNSPVTVNFACNDALSGVATCTDPITETADGIYDLAGTAIDKAGNTQTDPLEIKIDQTAPTINYTVTPTPNSSDWNNSSVTVSFTCHDDTSGIASCPNPITVSTEGANQVVTGTAIDNAGNTASTTAIINVDKTLPNITATVTPAPNSNGWNNSNVTVSFACSDVLSGINSCSAPVTISQEGANQTAIGTAIDNAGNMKQITVPVSVDMTAPTITTSVAPAPTATGWDNSPTTVTFTCADALSGIASCPAPVTVNSETPGQTVSGTAVDLAGNTATTSVVVKVDQTAPVVTGISWSANPLLQGQNTTLKASVSEALSGVAHVYYSIEGGTPQPMAYDATSNTWDATFGASLAVNTYNVGVWAVDNAGNTGQPLTDVLAVYNTTNGYVSGHAWLLPTASDTLPIALDMSDHPTQLVIGFSAKQGATTSVDAHYVVKNNQNEFDFSSTSVDWVVIPDSSHISVMVHGTMTTYINRVVSTTDNVSMRLDVVLGTNGAADQVTVNIWNPGLSPASAAPTYQISDADIANKSNVVIH